MLLLVAGAAAQEACRFCPLDPAVAAPACSTSVSGCTGWVIDAPRSDGEADAIKHCTVISGTLTIQSFTLTASGLAKLSNLDASTRRRLPAAPRWRSFHRPRQPRVCWGKLHDQGKCLGHHQRPTISRRWRRWETTLRRRRHPGRSEPIHRVACDTVLQFEHAVIGDPGASVVDYYVGGSDCAGDCALPGTPACATCSATGG